MKLISYSARDNQIRPGALLPNNTVLDLGETYRDALRVITAGLTVVPDRDLSDLAFDSHGGFLRWSLFRQSQLRVLLGWKGDRYD
jgi:hypothetical protein